MPPTGIAPEPGAAIAMEPPLIIRGRSSDTVSSKAAVRPVPERIEIPGAAASGASGRGRAMAPVIPPPARTVRSSSSFSAHSSPLGPRISVANRKKASPAVRKMSPIDATFCTGQIGMGMMSPKAPSRSRKSTAFALCSGWCSTVLISPVSPEAA